MPPAPRPIRFLIVGLWNTVFGYGTFVAAVAATRALNVSYLYATVPAQILGILNAYFCHRVYTWADGDKSFAGFVRFSAVYWVIFAVNAPLLVLLVDGLGLLPEIAQGILLVGNVVVSYLAHGRWSFRTSAPRPPRA